MGSHTLWLQRVGFSVFLLGMVGSQLTLVGCKDDSQGLEDVDSDPPDSDSDLDSDQDSDQDTDPDTDIESTLSTCSCSDAGVSLTAVDGCENFGGDEEQCSGWTSCELENGLTEGSSHESGTSLTCFGCTIRIECP